MNAPLLVSRRRWLAGAGVTLAGLGLGGRFLNEEMRAQTMSAERQAAVTPGLVQLSLNENPYGPAPSAREAMQRVVASDRCARYPYSDTRELVQQIARHEGVSPPQIVLGVGSGELLETLGVHCGLKGGEVLYAAPGYLQLPRAFEAVGGRARAVPLNARLEHDLPAMAAEVGDRTRVVYVANPHNPTGTTVDATALRAFVEDVAGRTTLLVDEAYLDIADDAARRSVVDLVRDDRRLVVARTFSKIHGLAGLRIGYFVTSPALAAELRRYSVGGVSAPAVAAAAASLADVAFVTATRARIIAERARFTTLLRELGRTYAESQGNFVFFHAGRPQAEIAVRMQAEGIAVARAFPPLLDWVRISVGLPEENTRALAALRRVLA